MLKKKKGPTILSLQETYSSFKDTHRLKTKGRKKIFHVNGNGKRAGVTMFILDEIDIRSNLS